MNKLNIAVVGLGYWGKNLVKNVYKLGVLHTICDSNQETLDRIKDTYPLVHPTTSYQEVLSRSAVDGVVISTPAVTHYSMVKEALVAGKDVFVEKPLALTVKEGEELFSLAGKKKKILMVGHLLEYHPAIVKLKDLVDSGELGKINYIYSNRLNLGKFRTEENVMWSFAPHDISVILLLLGQMPVEVSSHGGTYITPGVPDTTITNLNFGSGTQAHIYVSWLHPYKEQRLVVIGDKKMAVFDGVAKKNRLVVYDHRVKWQGEVPTPEKNGFTAIRFSSKEPLAIEIEHFLACLSERTEPKTSGASALRVLRVLEACGLSLKEDGTAINTSTDYFVHPTSIVEQPVSIGKGTKIWHFCHVSKDASIGKECTIGQNVFVGERAKIGNRVKVENNVSVFSNITLEDEVFVGPSATFTNVLNPRSFICRRGEFRGTLMKKGATVGANATIICGHTIGEYAFVGAGAVVTKDVPDYALVYGNPAQIQGWMCQCGEKLDTKDGDKTACSVCKTKYKLTEDKIYRLA